MGFDPTKQRSSTDLDNFAQRDIPDGTTALQTTIVDETTGRKLKINADGSITSTDIGLNDTAKDGNTIYLGQEDRAGVWIVQKIVKSVVSGVTLNTFYYATIKNNPTEITYANAWSAHVSLIYGKFSEAF